MSRARPKSQILATRPSDTSTFLAAKSRWMHWGQESTAETQLLSLGTTSSFPCSVGLPPKQLLQKQGQRVLIVRHLEEALCPGQGVGALSTTSLAVLKHFGLSCPVSHGPSFSLWGQTQKQRLFTGRPHLKPSHSCSQIL